jgi:hypothetical protein
MKLPQIKPIRLGGYELDVNHFLTRDYDDIHAASAELPALIEWINEQHQVAREDVLRLEAQLKRLEATTWHNLTSEGGWATAGYAGRPTVDALQRAIILDLEVTRMRELYVKADALSVRLNHTRQSFIAKLDLVRSSEANRRQVFDDLVSPDEHRQPSGDDDDDNEDDFGPHTAGR